MRKFDKFQEKAEQFVGPLSQSFSENRYIKALSNGMIATMPLTLGVSFIAILINFPVTAWTDFLTNIGVYSVGQEFLSATLSLLAIYMIILISYQFMKNEGGNITAGVVLSVATFLALIPNTIVIDETTSISALKLSYLGSDGMFVAMICGLVVPAAFLFLSNRKLTIKLPDSVPPMVTQALEPTFVAIILFSIVFLLKYVLTLTPYTDVFTMINTLISRPVMALGASPWSIIIFYCFANFCWFFGIHPGPLIGAFVPVLYGIRVANTEAFLADSTLPYLTSAVVAFCVFVGGNGNTLGFCLASFTARSEKYRSMRKLFVIPNLFNINEPVIFGVPIMLNAIYFIPMVASSLISGLSTLLLLQVIPVNFNPTVTMPWVTPGFVTAFLQGGIGFLTIWLVALFLHFLLWLPFVKVADKIEVQKEQAAVK